MKLSYGGPVSSAANDAGNASQLKRLRLIATQFITRRGDDQRSLRRLK